MRTSKPTTITFGTQQRHVDAWLESGEFTTASEIARAGVRALARERAAIDEVLREKAKKSLADQRPNIPAETVFANLEAFHREQERQLNAKAK